MRIKMKILIPVITLTLIVAATILVSNIVLFSNYVDETLTDTVSSSAVVAGNSLETLKKQAAIAAPYLAENDAVRNALSANDREALLEGALRLQNETGMEFCTITDPAGTVVLRTHEPDNYGDSVASQANVQAAMVGQRFTGVEPGTAVRLSVRSGAPVYDDGGNLVGVVSVGFRLDTEAFVDSVKALTASETTIFLGDERIATTVLQADGTRAVGTQAEAEVSRVVLSGGTYAGDAAILGRAAVANYAPISGPGGEVVGILFVGHYADETAGTIRSFVMSGVLITLVLLAASVAILLFVVNRIVANIKTMVNAAAALAVGDTGIDVAVNTKDEMRDLADAFNFMTENTRRQVEVVEAMAEGDLSVTVEARSPKDAMNHALSTMIEKNNSVFRNITASTSEVSMGAGQVADGAQILAQGATEQAASIEELSGAMTEISEKTNRNAEIAKKTAALADSIKRNAEKGSSQMDGMMNAVRDISKSSNDIGKVIKVIDDIAFQTNILALNAAVEAARAGQHGKGFAVVADEVRNLAAKSAEAAKDTESLIAGSMEKAKLGVSIAGETAASLAEIVSGINESSVLVGEIAASSEEQSHAVTEIHGSLDQVATVVQQNSATAEESAAASEEMSGQAAMLLQLISQFKLREEARPSHAAIESGPDGFMQQDGTGFALAGAGKY